MSAHLQIEARVSAVWQGIEADYPPVLRHDWPELRAMAEALLDSRRKRFPGLVSGGQLTAEAAAGQIALFEQIAADWRWLCTGEGEAAPLATLHDRREALDESLRTVAAIAGQHGGFDAKLADKAHRLIALRWHLEPEQDVRAHSTARLNHELRARALAAVALKQRSDSADQKPSKETSDG